MKVLVVAGGHYFRKKDGTVYVASLFDHAFYERYMNVFADVYVIARMKDTEDIPRTAKIVSGKGLHFLPIPETQGPKEYLRERQQTIQLVRNYIKQFDCAIFRISESTAHLVCREYMKTNKDFALEVIVDPWEFFSPGTVASIARPFIRILWTIEMKRACMKAKGVSYVTERYLQKKYPCKAMKGKSGYFTAHYSSVDLPDDLFGRPRIHKKKSSYVISHVANAFTGYGKGQTEVMRVVKLVRARGYDVSVRFVGDGPLRTDFEQFADTLCIGEYCEFLGTLPDSAAVREVIKKSDLMLFPTRGEGLPRVVLEAMAEGLPVISTSVCGIPEILQSKMLFKASDIKGMADMVCQLIEDPKMMDKISAANIRRAYGFRKSKLQGERDQYYRKIMRMGESD